MTALFDHDFEIALKRLKSDIKIGRKNVNTVKKEVTLITGKITEQYIKNKAKRVEELFPNLKVNVLAIKNDYFGNEITVTGLVTGRDIIKNIEELKKNNCSVGDYIVLPEVMLKEDEDIFLDDTLLTTLQEKIDTKVVVSDGTASGFIKAIVNKIPNKKIYKFKDKSTRQSYENSIYH